MGLPGNVEAAPRRSLRLIFWASLLIEIAFSAFLFFGSLLLRPLISPLLSTNTLEIYDIVFGAIQLAIYPFLFFVLFYKIGAVLKVDMRSEYFSVLKLSFVGGTVGVIIGYLLLIGLNIVYYVNPIAELDALFIANVAVSFLRTSSTLAILALAGVAVGSFRSERTHSEQLRPS